MGNCQLSVIIPCHDFGRYLSGAIASVLNQESSVKSMEVIVVDDHSCDSETVDVLESWKNVDSRVYVLENPGMPGSATARNLGIESARGEWLAFLDADDIWLPGSIQTRWDVIEREEDAQWVCADHLIWLEDGSVEQEGFFMKGDLSRQIFSQAYDTGTVLRLRKPVRESLTTMLAWTGTVMVKRELMQRLGGFETSLRRAMDLNMWVRLANETDLFFIPRVVALYRQHNASVSHEDVAPHLWDIAA